MLGLEEAGGAGWPPAAQSPSGRSCSHKNVGRQGRQLGRLATYAMPHVTCHLMLFSIVKPCMQWAKQARNNDSVLHSGVLMCEQVPTAHRAHHGFPPIPRGALQKGPVWSQLSAEAWQHEQDYRSSRQATWTGLRSRCWRPCLCHS